MDEKTLHVGCAMWNHRDWRGRSIPSSTRPGEELAAYAQLLNAVEGNTTFYALPKLDVAKRWADSVPDNFRFMFKLPQTVTHHRKLRDTDEEVRAFFAALEPLHGRMQPIAIQLPASFAPSDLPVLETFLSTASKEFAWAVEVRHPGFYADDSRERVLNDSLHRHGANRITLDSRALFEGPCQTAGEVDAFENKPRLPVRAVATADQPIVRFIGQTAMAANPPFWAPWATTVRTWVEEGKRPIVFIHTPDNVDAPSLARQFHAQVAADSESISALPEAPAIAEQRLFD